MASFDYFSEPTVAHLNTNLFSENATAGLAAAKQLPSTTTSLIQGLIGGYEEGQKIHATDQQSQITQNQIEQLPVQNARQAAALTHDQQQNTIDANSIQQLPVTNAQQQATLTHQQTANQLDAIKLQTETLTQDTNNKTAQETAEAQLAQAKQVNDNIKLQQQLKADLQSTDADTLKGILFSGKYSSLMPDSKSAQSIVGQVSSRVSFSPEEHTKLANQIDYMKERELEATAQEKEVARATAYAGKLQTAREDFLGSSAGYYAKGVPESQLFDNIKIVPGRQGIADPQTGQLYDDTPPPLPSTGISTETGPPKYWVFKKNQDGKFMYQGDVPDETSFKNFEKYRGAYQSSRALSNLGIFGSLSGPSNQGTSSAGPSAPTPKNQFFMPGIPAGQPNPEAQPFEGPGQPQGIPNPEAPPYQTPPRSAVSEGIKAEVDNLQAPAGFSPGSLAAKIAAKNPEYQKKAAELRTQSTPVSSELAATSSQQPTVASTPPDPHEQVSKVIGKDVTLDTGGVGIVDTKTYNRIENEPLLQGKSPLLKGLVAVESGGDRNATSPTGVLGLAQVQQSTAAMYGLDRRVPEENLAAGERYLADQLHAFDGNVQFALAAYNAGPGYIKEAIKKVKDSGNIPDWINVKAELKKSLNPSKYNETSAYPDKVMTAAASFMKEGDTEHNTLYTDLLQSHGLVTPSSNKVSLGKEVDLAPGQGGTAAPFVNTTPPSVASTAQSENSIPEAVNQGLKAPSAPMHIDPLLPPPTTGAAGAERQQRLDMQEQIRQQKDESLMHPPQPKSNEEGTIPSLFDNKLKPKRLQSTVITPGKK